MKLIKADHHRRLEIPGVQNPVQRPVDIDKSQTGFAQLRSLRIYRFDADSVVNGHAEEDEVLIVVMAGTVELTLIDSNSEVRPRCFTVSAASDSPGHPCAAYLPPNAAYQLIPRTGSDVAYARATPAGGPPPHIFSSHDDPAHEGVALLLEEASYPRLLRVRLLQVRAEEHEIAINPIEEVEAPCEALIHFRTVPEERVATIAETGTATIPLTSWDTVAVAPGDHPTLRIAKGSSALVLIVLATCRISE
jgi:KduI/IolB family